MMILSGANSVNYLGDIDIACTETVDVAKNNHIYQTTKNWQEIIMHSPSSSLQNEISRLIVDSLNLEDVEPSSIDPKAPLFGEGLGLDSIDALEIGAAISKRYRIKLQSQDEATEKHFSTVESLARFVENATKNQIISAGG